MKENSIYKASLFSEFQKVDMRAENSNAAVLIQFYQFLVTKSEDIKI